MRVKVMDGTGENLLGYGSVVGLVDVYAIEMPDGSLRSLGNAEEAPPEEAVRDSGGELVLIESNAKIALDEGRVVYGCQVWWEPASDCDSC